MALNFALGNIANFASGLMANASSSTAYKRQIGLMQEQARLNYHYAQQSAENSPSWNRKGLETAGYNPMLAVQNATAGVNSSWASQAQSTPTDTNGAINAGVNASSTAQRVENETAQTASNINTNNATAFKANQEGLAQQLRNPYISNREKAEIGEIETNTARLESENRYNDAAIANMDKTMQLQEKIANMEYAAHIYSADRGYAGTIYNADTHKNIADEHSPSGKSQSFQNYTSGVRSIMSGIGDIIHGRSDTYETYHDTTTETYRDKKTGTTKQYSSSRKGKTRKK